MKGTDKDTKENINKNKENKETNKETKNVPGEKKDEEHSLDSFKYPLGSVVAVVTMLFLAEEEYETILPGKTKSEIILFYRISSSINL